MATQYSGGPYVTFNYVSDGTINSMITMMQNQLTSAGWSVVTSVAGNILMKSGTTPMGLNDCFRFKNNSATSMTVSLQNASGTLIGGNSTTSGGYICPLVGQTYRVMATPFWFLIVQIGNFGNRSFVYGGVLYLPPFMSSVYECGMMMCNCYNDAGAGNGYNQWRGIFGWSQNTVTNFQVTTNGQILDIGSNLLNCGNCWQCAATVATTQFFNVGITNCNNFLEVLQWSNGAAISSDPLMSWAIDSAYSQICIRGQLYDATLVMQTMPGDATLTFGGHNWFNITNNNWWSSLFFATS